MRASHIRASAMVAWISTTDVPSPATSQASWASPDTTCVRLVTPTSVARVGARVAVLGRCPVCLVPIGGSAGPPELGDSRDQPGGRAPGGKEVGRMVLGLVA